MTHSAPWITPPPPLPFPWRSAFPTSSPASPGHSRLEEGHTLQRPPLPPLLSGSPHHTHGQLSLWFSSLTSTKLMTHAHLSPDDFSTCLTVWLFDFHSLVRQSTSTNTDHFLHQQHLNLKQHPSHPAARGMALSRSSSHSEPFLQQNLTLKPFSEDSLQPICLLQPPHTQREAPDTDLAHSRRSVTGSLALCWPLSPH